MHVDNSVVVISNGDSIDLHDLHDILFLLLLHLIDCTTSIDLFTRERGTSREPAGTFALVLHPAQALVV